ncbi:MAG: hypothetical protein DRJ01_04935 [Bacteroidetes bacterium]|nr:MAG: hypothetical protein DRJ01_04935 [Bacteroidota bacterium]
MKRIIKIVSNLLYAALVATMFIYGVGVIKDERSTIAKLEADKIELVAQGVKDYENYSNTIKDIVYNIQITDSYLFVGGFNQEESAEFNVKKYEDMLLLKSDLDGLLKNTENFFDERTEYMNNLPNIWPLKDSDHIRVTSPWGDRYSPFTGNIYHHDGIDLKSWDRDIVIATADGVVVEHWLNHPIFGKYLVIKHEDGLMTHYAHLAKSYVVIGDKVKRGEDIGMIGNSGESTGIHIHYAISHNGEWVDPAGYLRAPRYELAKLTK